MTTAVQVQFRRGTATQVASFTGAVGEVNVDTTNNRVVVQDGSTAGGWAAAKLAETQTIGRTTVADTAYTALATDRTVVYTSLTAARIVTLPAASGFAAGNKIRIGDETGACSPGNTITVTRAGSDTICGLTSLPIANPYGSLVLESSGTSKWSLVPLAPGQKVLLNALVASSSANLQDTTSLLGPFHAFEIELVNVLPATNNTTLDLTFKSGGSFVSSGYSWSLMSEAGAGSDAAAATSAINIPIIGGGPNISNSSYGVCGSLKITNPAGTTAPKPLIGNIVFQGNGGLQVSTLAGTWLAGNGAVTGLNFQFASGSIASGGINIYGLA